MVIRRTFRRATTGPDRAAVRRAAAGAGREPTEGNTKTASSHREGMCRYAEVTTEWRAESHAPTARRASGVKTTCDEPTSNRFSMSLTFDRASRYGLQVDLATQADDMGDRDTTRWIFMTGITV